MWNLQAAGGRRMMAKTGILKSETLALRTPELVCRICAHITSRHAKLPVDLSVNGRSQAASNGRMQVHSTAERCQGVARDLDATDVQVSPPGLGLLGLQLHNS